MGATITGSGTVPEPSPRGLLARALARLAAGALVLSALFFGTAGTFDYWEAWVWMGLMFTPMTFLLIYLLRHDRALLERRLQARERLSGQRVVIVVTSVILVAAYVLPGLDRRFGWSDVPAPVVIAADACVMLGYLLFVMVLRENSYAARTVQVEAGQKVVTTGPYRWVRHPMYSAVLMMYGLSPLALGSYWAMLCVVLLPVFLVARIRGEEKLLRKELPGYVEYCEKTRHRLIPGVW